MRLLVMSAKPAPEVSGRQADIRGLSGKNRLPINTPGMTDRHFQVVTACNPGEESTET
jgi:hypothetical protein